MEEAECLLARVYENPGIIKDLGRKERLAALSQVLFVWSPIAAGVIEMDAQEGLKDEDFELAHELWTVKEAAAKLKVSTRSVQAGIKSGRYPFAIKDGRSIRISRVGFQKWLKTRAKPSPGLHS